MRCENGHVLSNKGPVIEHSSEFDYRSIAIVNRTFDCVHLAKYYCEFDVRLSLAIERVVFDWARLPNCSIRYPGHKSEPDMS